MPSRKTVTIMYHFIPSSVALYALNRATSPPLKGTTVNLTCQKTAILIGWPFCFLGNAIIFSPIPSVVEVRIKDRQHVTWHCHLHATTPNPFSTRGRGNPTDLLQTRYRRAQHISDDILHFLLDRLRQSAIARCY